MILTAHQTGYFPWLGLLAKIASAEQYVHFDIVPCEGSGVENRVQIRTNSGPQWLTVPVRKGLDTPLKDVEICADSNWRRKHWRTLELAYGKAPYFKRHGPWVEAVLARDWTNLSDMNMCVLVDLLDILGIHVEVHRASDYKFSGAKSDLVLDMCRKMGAGEYVFGQKGKDYADVSSFEAAGIGVQFQEYKHPVYPQMGSGFISGLSILDLLFNCGPDSRAILTGEK